MSTWQPRPSELLLTRSLIAFASGVAPKVAGMRWFRDTDRNDIQDALPGWPAGPHYAPRSESQGRARTAGRFGVRALYVAVVGTLENMAGTGTIMKGPSSIKASPEDVENEVEDFPVMWAAPGTVARGLPWQLDRGRRPTGYRTTALVTDQRIVVIGDPNGSGTRTELLWECERSDIAAVEKKPYSNESSDTVIRFKDGSWCRMHVYSGAWFRYLAAANELIDLETLTPGQRRAVDALVAKHDFGQPPVISRRPSGNYLVELLTPNAFPTPGQPISVTHLMGPDGSDVASHPDDF